MSQHLSIVVIFEVDLHFIILLVQLDIPLYSEPYLAVLNRDRSVINPVPPDAGLTPSATWRPLLPPAP